MFQQPTEIYSSTFYIIFDELKMSHRVQGGTISALWCEVTQMHLQALFSGGGGGGLCAGKEGEKR